jgi:hypothetical protein
VNPRYWHYLSWQKCQVTLSFLLWIWSILLEQWISGCQGPSASTSSLQISEQSCILINLSIKKNFWM